MIPTLFGIMLISFIIVQFAPGGPIERIIAQLNGTNVDATSRIGGASSEVGRIAQPGSSGDAGVNSRYRGARGLDPELIKSLEKQFGFDKPPVERFFLMMGNYLTLNFGQSYFRDVSVLQAHQGKIAGLDFDWPLDDAAQLCHFRAVGRPQGCDRWLAIRHLDEHRHHRRLRYSKLPFRDLSDRHFRGRLLPRLVPVAGTYLRQLAAIELARQNRRLFLASGAAAHCHGDFVAGNNYVPHEKLVPR